MSSLRALPRVVLWLVIVAVGAATLLGFLDRVSWTLELAGFFRFQYVIVLGAAAVVALLLRTRQAAVVAVALALVNVAVVAPRGAEAAAPATGGENVRVLVANVDFRSRAHARMAKLIRDSDADVVVLTELTPAWAEALAAALAPYREREVRLGARAYGLGIYSRLPVTASRIERFPRDGGPPTAVVEVDVRGTPLTLVGTHVHRPIEGEIHADHLEALAAAVPRLGSPLVICGDFNTPPWTGPFRELTGRAGLEHLYQGSWPAHTWPTWNPALRLPLDNCAFDGVSVVEHRRAADVGSDHYPLLVDYAVPPPAAHGSR